MAQEDESILEEAKSLMVQGRRCMALEDYQTATDLLEHSCQLFDAFYGVGKRECADAYLEYGLALVAMANLEANSGTDKLMKKAGITDEGDDDEEDDDDNGDVDEEAEGEGEEADAENEKPREPDEELSDDKEATPNEQGENNKTAENGQNKTNGVAGSSNGESSTTTNNEACNSATEQEPVAGTSDGLTTTNNLDAETEEVENEEATPIEIAWEVLCLAKRLYMTDESMEGRLKLAETLQKIGEISIEWDNNDNAVSILEECLKIRQAILPPEDRLIAFTYYHLGLAHSFQSDTQNANDNFQNAINVIEKRIASLNKELEKAKEVQDTIVVGTYQKEINELKELLPEMTMRIDDSKEDSIKSNDVLKRTREEMQMEDDEVKKVCSDKSKPVDDISHLVKRKTG